MNQPFRILIVDDDQRMTRTLADILTLYGYTVTEACSGPEAIAKARTAFFDCVLTDVRMPGLNGVELHHQLAQLQPGLPVVLMTAYASDEIIRQGLEAGVFGVLNKPLEMANVLAFLQSLRNLRTITIVDDDPAFGQTLGGILEQRGFAVKQIVNPHTAVEEIADEAQIILLDMKLNSLNGLDILKSLRQRYPSLPVVIITAYRREMSAAIQQAIEINAYTCLYKPLVIPELLKTIAAIQRERLKPSLPGG